MSMWPLLVVYGALVGADVLRALQRSNPGGLRGFLRDTSGAIRGRLHAAYGTELSLESLLADVALANAASRELLGPGGVDGRVVGGGSYYRFSIGWRGRPRAFLWALRVNRRLAYAFGRVIIDIEELGTGDREGGAGGGGEEDDGFEKVSCIRVTTLEHFYGFVLPALQQLEVDLNFRDGRAGVGLGRWAGPEGAQPGTELEECCVCMENSVDTVTSCGHEFCAVCVARWVQVSGSCPVCRSPEQARDAWTLFEATREANGAAERLQEMTQDKFRSHINSCPAATVQRFN